MFEQPLVFTRGFYFITMHLFDILEHIYTETLECTIEDLEAFADKATDNQQNKLAELILAEQHGAAKELFRSIVN